jgi:hypothetical protein
MRRPSGYLSDPLECAVYDSVLQLSFINVGQQSRAFYQATNDGMKSGFLFRGFSAKIVEGLAKVQNLPYVSRSDAAAAFHMRL